MLSLFIPSEGVSPDRFIVFKYLMLLPLCDLFLKVKVDEYSMIQSSNLIYSFCLSRCGHVYPSQINYNFVAGMYFFASVLFLILAVLDKVIMVHQVEGFYIIFSPFLPCLLWSLVVRSKWLKQEKSKTE